MAFEDVLLDYEKQIILLESSFADQQRILAEKQLQCERRIADINEELKRWVAQINELEMNKYTALAVEELKPYLQSFEIDTSNVPAVNNAGLITLHNSVEKLREERVHLEQTMGNIVVQIQQKQAEFEQAKAELTRPVQEQYRQVSLGTVKDYDIVAKTFPFLDELSKEAVIGSIVKPTNSILSNIDASNNLYYPLTLDLLKGGNVILQTSKQIANEEMSRIFVALGVKILEAFPYGTLKVGIVNYTSFDCVDALHRAIAKSEASLGDLVADIRGIDQLIADVTKRCSDINGKLLANNCSNLFELFDKGIKTEQFQLILIKDALKDISEANLRMLYSWVATFAKCGVRFVLVDDFSEETFRGKSATFKGLVEQIKAACQFFTISGKGIVNDNNEAVELISLSKNNTDSDVFVYCSQYVKHAADKKSAYISYEQIGFGKDNNKNDTSISIPIAYCAPNVWNIEFHCTSKAPLANLIVGVPGTGKSRLIDAMILNGAMKYSPDEVVFHLLDFKQALSSDAYLTDCRIPHVKVVSRENKAEEADIIMSSILSEIEARGDLFKQVGVDNIAGYNKVSEKKIPRIIIVVDECQHLFEDDNLSKKCENIVREGRAFGIHLVLATQTVNQQMMKTIKFVDGLYCFQVAPADADMLLDKEHSKRLNEINKESHKAFAADFSSGVREFVKIEPAFDGDIDENRTKRSGYAELIRRKWSGYPIDVVDAGNQDSLTLSQLKDVSPYMQDDYDFYIGQNFQTASDICFRFRREKQSALFMVSSNETLTESIMSSVAIQACMKGLQMLVVNAMGDKTLSKVCDLLPSSNKMSLYRESGYLDALCKVYRTYQERMRDPNKYYEPIFFMVNGLQNLLDFSNNIKKEFAGSQTTSNSDDTINVREMSFDEILARQSQMRQAQIADAITVNGKGSLLELIANAYRVNIFVCCAIDSINLSNAMGNVFSSQDKNIIKECNYKVIDVDVGENIQNIMENSFKLRMLNNMSESVCFVSERQRNYYKAKFVQYDLDFPSTKEKIESLLKNKF